MTVGPVVGRDLLGQLAGVAGTVITDPDAMEAYRRDQCLFAAAGRSPS